MPTNKLTALKVDRLKKPGRHSDGEGLYLVISKGGRRRWVFIHTRDGRRREVGLGSARGGGATLTQARNDAQSLHAELRAGRDLLASIRALRLSKLTQAPDVAAPPPSFGAFADAHISAFADSWRNPKHRAQWRMTLAVYAAPLRDKALTEITTQDVLDVLMPIWLSKNETARRLRGRLEVLLDAAKAKGLRTGDNPARYRGHLKILLPKYSGPANHFAALPFAEVPTFMRKVRVRREEAARALEFAVLTAMRTTEVRKAQWSEVDLDRALWTIPASRMKNGMRAHVVPLSPRALAILNELNEARFGDFVFPGRTGKGLCENAMLAVIRRMGYDKGVATTHGFRSACTDWGSERTHFSQETIEMAMSHTIRSKTEAAYRRGDLLEKRRDFMRAWADFCESEVTDNIVEFPTSSAG